MQGDLISRDELLKAIDTWDKFGVDETNSLFRLDNLSLPYYVPYIHYDDVIKCIKGMPSVNPQEPKYCDRNICISNEYNGISCDECEVTKSQEKSGDLISRQGVLDYIHRILNQGMGKKKSFEFIQKYVEKLSPVNTQEPTWVTGADGAKIAFKDVPAWKVIKICEILDDVVEAEEDQEPTGHWVEDEYEMEVRCSVCGEENDECSNYCPNCGCCMVEPQEREDKE